MEKTIQILIKDKLQRPRLLCGGSYYKIYLPENVMLGPNQFEQVELKFKIQETHSIPIQLLSNSILKKYAQSLKIYGELINTSDTECKKAVVNLTNRGDCCRYLIPKNTEIVRLYLFVAKDDIIYTKYKYRDNGDC